MDKVVFMYVHLKNAGTIVAFRNSNSGTVRTRNAFGTLNQSVLPSEIEQWRLFIIRRKRIQSSDTLFSIFDLSGKLLYLSHQSDGIHGVM